MGAAGNTVYMFEPHPVFYKALRSKVRNSTQYRLQNVAIGPEEGTFKLQYNGETYKVEMAPLTKYVHIELDLLAIYVQGAYTGVLGGSTGIPVRSYWIEVSSCTTKIREAFNLLEVVCGCGETYSLPR